MAARSDRSASPPHVVILGGGFAGLAAARALKKAPVSVTVIDRTNHYLFQPLLYQVATGVLSPADVAVPIRVLLRKQKNATVLLADVDGIDLDARTVTADGGTMRVSFDYLIVATGSRHSYFGHPEWERAAPGLKTLDDAREIRRRFLMALERAEKSADTTEHAALMTFVVIGGGPTGVELAGILPTIAQKGFKHDFRRIDPRRVRVLLLEGGPRLLPTFDKSLSERAFRDLTALGVQCRTNAMVTRVTSEAVYLGEERIDTRTVFWAAGNAASPLVRTMRVPTDRMGRAHVLPDLSIASHRNVFVVGDAASAVMASVVPGAGDHAFNAQQYVPGLASAANQMGAHAARMILNAEENRIRTPFKYRDKGEMAVIGRGLAVASLGRVKLTGPLAFYAWLFVHLLYLAGFRNRLSVMLEWAYAYFTYRPGARLLTRDDVHATGAHPNAATEPR